MKLRVLIILFFVSQIPVFNLSAQVENAIESVGYNLHRVTKQQTLYGLSKEYNITADEIKSANGGLPNGLQEGMLIKIPVHENSKPEKPEPVSQAKPEKNSYFEYQARVKESIYPLAVRYQVSVDSILALNPGITETLRKDQIIKIPVVKNTSGYIAHTVRNNQPLSGLAKDYNVSVDEIKSINPYISRTLTAGQSIRIPVMKMDNDESIKVELLPAKVEPKRVETPEVTPPAEDFCEKDHSSETFKIALMLPLYLNQVEVSLDTNFRNEGSTMKSGYLKSFTFIQFYEGFLMAVDSLKQLGLNCELFVYNVEDDLFEVERILANPELKSMDLIVGPAFAKTFAAVAEFARNHQISIVNPFSTRNEITYNNPFVFKVKPSIEYQYETLAEFLHERFSKAEIFVVRQNQYRDEDELVKLKAALDRKLTSNSVEPYHEIIYSNDSLFSFIRKSSTQNQNVFVIYSENKAFILDMLRKLNEMRDKYQFTVVGLPNWKRMEDIEIEYVINLNTHFLSTEYINFDSQVVNRFVKHFREKFQTEPQQYAYQGFDTGTFFLNALMKYGDRLNDCIQNFDYNGMESGYHFVKLPDRGFINKYWKVLRVVNYQYEDVSPVFSD